MRDLLVSESTGFPENAVSLFTEMAAYEALWSDKTATFKRLADSFRNNPDSLPSDMVPQAQIDEFKHWLRGSVFTQFDQPPGIRFRRTGDYPDKLLAAANPLEVLYFVGNWDLVYRPSVAVVGARKVSEDGKRRCTKLVRDLVGMGYTIVSGLADGVDKVAHDTCLAVGGNTIGVLGTPLNQAYPAKNAELQSTIAKEHLLISQVPFKRYESQDYRSNRAFFPERNVTMSALTEATVIVEASDTSGTLYQARAAIRQGRKLFILNSCFENQAISWPAKYEAKGAIRVRSLEDITEHLPSTIVG